MTDISATRFFRSTRAFGTPDGHDPGPGPTDTGATMASVSDFYTQAAVHPGPSPESFARQDGEDWYVHEQRVHHGLSMGHLTPEQGDQYGAKYQSSGWKPLPQTLYHTTTDAAGVAEHGLKAGHELGQKNGHGLGGTPEWLSMTDRADHAHTMLNALHEYHDHLNGKTTYADLHAAAQRGEGGDTPYHEEFQSAAAAGDNEHALASRMRGKRLEPGFHEYEEAHAKGWTPHPTAHHSMGAAKDGKTYGSGWERDPTLYERHSDYGAFSRSRDWAGHGTPSTLFLSNDREAFAKKDPANFAVLKVRPKPGAQGFEKPGEHEWRTGTGDAVHVDGEPLRRTSARIGGVVPPFRTPGSERCPDCGGRGEDSDGHECDPCDGSGSITTPVPDNHEPYQHPHDWLPRDHFFAPAHRDLDQRLFDGDHMHPAVRQHILGLINAFWAPRYGDTWQSWARVYLAGSEASHFYGNDDLDVLIGIDYEAARHHVDAFTGEPNGELDTKLTDELKTHLNDAHRMLPGPEGAETGPWESTFYVNPGSYHIRAIKPYAAYDITRDEWAVKPVEVPADFGPDKLPESTWDILDALRALVKAVGELPAGTREREGAALYDYLHSDRHAAFGPDGTGLYDPANADWKALDAAPGHPLQLLIDWKHAHDGATATDQENAA